MKCPKCSEEKSGLGLYRHFNRRHTNEEIECPFCSKSFNNFQGLTNHIIYKYNQRDEYKGTTDRTSNTTVVKKFDIIELILYPERKEEIFKKIDRRVR